MKNLIKILQKNKKIDQIISELIETKTQNKIKNLNKIKKNKNQNKVQTQTSNVHDDIELKK